MAEEGLQIPVSFTLEEARAALRQLEQAARDAGRRAGEGLDLDKPASGGRGGISKLKGQLGQARESMMFFTSALGEMGEGGRRAQGLLAGMAGAFLGGGPLLLGLEAARFGVSLLADAFTEQAKAAEEARDRTLKAGEEISQFLAEAGVRRAREAAIAAGMTAEAWDAASDRLEREAAIQDRVIERRAELARIEEAIDRERYESASLAFGANGTLNSLLETQKTIVQQLADAEKALALTRAAAAQAATNAAADDIAAREAELWLAQNGPLSRRVPGARAAGFSPTEESQKANLAAMKKDFDDIQMRINAIVYGEPLAIPVDPQSRQWLKDATAELDAFAEATRRAQEDLIALGTQGMSHFSQSVSGEFGKIFRSSRSYEKAMRAAGGATQAAADLSGAAFAAFAQNALAAVAQEASGRAIFETAMGLGALARSMWDPSAKAEALLHFQSAAAFAAVGAAVGAGAYGIGQVRGMTKAEKADVANARGGGDLETPTGPRELGADPEDARGGPTIIVNFSGRALVTEAEVKRELADLMRDAKASGMLS